MPVRAKEFAFARPSLVREKIHRLELLTNAESVIAARGRGVFAAPKPNIA